MLSIYTLQLYPIKTKKCVFFAGAENDVITLICFGRHVNPALEPSY